MGHIYCFHTQGPVMHLSSVLPHCIKIIDNMKQDDLGLKLRTQTLPDPALLEPFYCNKVTMDMDTLSIFFHSFFQ